MRAGSGTKKDFAHYTPRLLTLSTFFRALRGGEAKWPPDTGEARFSGCCQGRVIPYLVVAFCQYHKMHRSRAGDAEKLWLKFFEERACKTARERVQCQTVSAGNKNPGDTIFCGQTGYNPVKLPIFCVCPLDKTTRWDYHRPCTDQGNDDEIGKSESRENLDSDDGTFSQAYFVYGKKKRRSQGTNSPGGAADDLISVS